MKSARIRIVLVIGSVLMTIVPLQADNLSAGELVLENRSLRYSVACRDGAITSRSFVNRLTGKVASLSVEEFLLEFQEGIVIRSSDCKVTVLRNGERSAELRCSAKPAGGPSIEIGIQYSLPDGKAYVRKQVSVRQKAGEPLRLLRADLEDWQGCRQLWKSATADKLPYGSHPIYCEDLWAGVEFVAAFNQYSREGFVLRSRPGGKPLSADWLPLHSTVIGAAPRDKVRQAFFDYIDDIRLAPPRFVSCYNTWWTYRPPIKEQELVALARELKQRLFDKHGVFFDIVATDEGWADKHTIWEMNRQTLPGGFASFRGVVESAGGKLGLWISPSAIYPNSTDTDWAARNGYSVVRLDNSRKGVSLCDPRYHEGTVSALQRLIRENRLAHVKFDGFVAREDKPHDGLLAGDDSVEPLAEQAIRLLRAAKDADREMVSEPTFFNSLVNYISPWIIQYADSVWGNAGGDVPRAIGPAPDYRESCTNAREWYIFSAENEVWLPQNALQFFDIIHCDAAHGFANHAAMALGRGRLFLPVYVTPKYLGDEDWSVLAGLLAWGKKNQSLLRNTTVLPSRVEQGEPYAYAHWSGRRGVVAIRNPSNESRTYGLDLRAAGAPPGLNDAVCYTQYPYRRGLCAGADADTIVSVPLAPWELLFVEIVPRADLAEAVAIGGRWFPAANGKMQVAADANAKHVRIVRPNVPDTIEAVGPVPAIAPNGKLLSRAMTATLAPGTKSGRPAAAAFDVSCEISVPASASGSVLLLVEYPGRQHFATNCTATVNAKPVVLEERSSKGRLGYIESGGISDYWAAKIPYVSEWTWYICPVSSGTAVVRFMGSAATPGLRIGVWAWTERDRSAALKALPVTCSRPEMPQVRPLIERHGVCLLRPTG